jgi:uncharacterized protein YcbX
LNSDEGKQTFCALVGGLVSATSQINPQWVESNRRRFTDGSVVSETMSHTISIINLSSVSELEKGLGHKLDYYRFRANIYISGLSPWEELCWLGKEIQIGTAVAKIVFETKRCTAINVNPTSAIHDISLLQYLSRHYHHSKCGVYALVTQGGVVSVGDKAHLL